MKSQGWPNASASKPIGDNRIFSPRAASALAAAAAAFTVFLLIGLYVEHHAEPPAFAAVALALRGHGTPIAWAFTTAGRASVLAPIYGLLVLVAIFSPAWRVAALVAVASGLACWGAADFFQHEFVRPRRLDWLVRREMAYSYPSSHAAISTGFYFLSGVLALRSNRLPQPARNAVFACMSVLTLGILWSRIELAAHNITDVIGGVLLALAIMLAGAAAFAAFAHQGRWVRVRSIR